MSYGLLTTGFSPKTLEVIRDELNQLVWDQFGASIDVSDRTPLGFIVGILANTYAELWELSEAVYSSQDPDSATGAALDALAALTGTIRKVASASTVTLTLTGTATTAVALGSKASTASTGVVFATTADATITALSAWAPTTAYVVGDRVTNSGRAYQCTVAGTSAGSGGPTTTASAIVDNTVTWRYLGEGAGAIDVAAACTETGPKVAASGDITEIETPVSGWDSVINVLDADLGTDVETDEALRDRRETELSDLGTSPIDALRAALLRVTDVEAVRLFVNNSDVTDGDGVPPHAIEALVIGGEDQDILDALHANVAAGIATHGTEAGTVEDTEGVSHDYEFSRPTEVDIHVEVTLTYDADEYPSDGDTQIKQAIVDWGDARGTGYDAVSSAIKAACFGVAGVLDVSLAYINTASPAVSEATIAISTRQLAKYDTSRITVNSSAGTP